MSEEPVDAKEKIDNFPTHLVMTIFWTLLIIPTMIWLRESILWVSFMSLYAICISHWTAHQAWKAERAAIEAEG